MPDQTTLSKGLSQRTSEKARSFRYRLQEMVADQSDHYFEIEIEIEIEIGIGAGIEIEIPVL